MRTSEQEVRATLQGYQPAGRVDIGAAVAAGRRQLRQRRARRTAGALILPLAAGAGFAVAAGGVHNGGYRLAGSGLTLAGGSTGPVQVTTDRVDLGDGVQAWRKGRLLNVGYPGGPHEEVDPAGFGMRWGNLGYDAGIFTEAGQHKGSTIVVGSVRGAPTSVVVTLEGVSSPATIACFTQAKGWCVYKANVPASFRSVWRGPQIRVR